MNGITHLRASARSSTPWKNGLGETREVAIFPPGADIASFGWRLSVAKVSKASHFSKFEGVDRVLTVIEGEISLQTEQSEHIADLSENSLPYAFSGETEIVGYPANGTAKDLNLMYRRSEYSGVVHRIHATSAQTVTLVPGFNILFFCGTGQLIARNQTVSAEPQDAVMITTAENEQIDLESKNDILQISIVQVGTELGDLRKQVKRFLPGHFDLDGPSWRQPRLGEKPPVGHRGRHANRSTLQRLGQDSVGDDA